MLDKTQLRLIIYKISRLPLIDKLFYFFYDLNFLLFKFIIGSLCQQVHLRRGSRRGELYPGLSDIDVLCITDKKENITQVVEKFKEFKILFPLVCDLEVMTIDMFNLWKKYGGVRAIEFSGINEQKHLSDSLTHEVFISYKSFISALSRPNETYRSYLLQKHLIDIVKVIDFHKNKEIDVLSNTRHEVAKKVLNFDYDPLKVIDSNKLCRLLINQTQDYFIKYVKDNESIISRPNFRSLDKAIPIFDKELQIIKEGDDFKKDLFSLTEEGFKALKFCGFQEHEIIQHKIKLGNSTLENCYKMRLLTDLAGALVHDGSYDLYFHLLGDIFELVNCKEDFNKTFPELSFNSFDKNYEVVSLNTRVRFLFFFKKFLLFNPSTN